MSWWLENNIRMVQNNLRDIDCAGIDPKTHVKHLKELGANTLQINCGGITSFYPTDLPFQYRSRYLKDDFLGKMVKECHENGIRVIGRFDFSKMNACFEDRYPEWFARRADGSLLRYNDTISTCVNSDYQQYKSSEILEEVITRYRIDGVFFNWFGYISVDYSGRNAGHCMCENCRRKFREMYGEELPEDFEGRPDLLKKYEEFKKVTVHVLLKRIRDKVKSISDDVAISTYTPDCVDIIRSESNTEHTRPLPVWPYASSENVSIIQDSYPDKVSSNISINAISLSHRYSTVDYEFNRLRLYEDLAAGAGLDFCILGDFDSYPDRKNLAGTKEVFQFHKKYENYYGHFDRFQKVMLIYDKSVSAAQASCRGIYKMLKEEHIPFRFVNIEGAESQRDCLDMYDHIIIPGNYSFSAAFTDALIKTMASVVAVGEAFRDRPDLRRALFGIRSSEEINATGTSMYVQTKPEQVFTELRSRGTEWMYLYGRAEKLTLAEQAEPMLPLVEASTFGPPERAYGNRETEIPTAVRSENGNVYIGYEVSALYYRYGQEILRAAFMACLAAAKPIARPVITDAPEMVEIFFNRLDEKHRMLSLLNFTGFNGTSFFRPVPLKNLHFRFPGLKITGVLKLAEKEERIPLCGDLTVDLDDVYSAYILETE